MSYAIPEVGSKWLSTRGVTYTVIAVANQKATRDGWVITVVYQDDTGEIWARPFSEWFEHMTEIPRSVGKRQDGVKFV